MLYSRRRLRRLLLPPGWVALGFLLLMGCWQVKSWERQLQPMRVLHLTMPALKFSQEDLQRFGRAYAIPYKSLDELDTLTNWRIVDFQANELNDFLSAATIESALIIGQLAKHKADGVRIRFRDNAMYANLVTALNIVNAAGQKRYFLDIRYQPMTLYVISDGVIPTDQRLVYQPFESRFSMQLPEPKIEKSKENSAQQLANLKKIKWSSSASLLALICSLSLWRLLRHKLKRTYS